MDNHLRELLKWSDDELDEALAHEPHNGVYKDFQSPSLLMFSREEIEDYNAAFHVDNAVCKQIISTVQDRVRQLQEIRRLKANLQQQKDRDTPSQQSFFDEYEPLVIENDASFTECEVDHPNTEEEEPEEETEQDIGRILTSLREWHRFTSEQLIKANRDLLHATLNRRQSEITELTECREQLQAKLTEIDVEIQAETHRLKRLQDAQETSQSARSTSGSKGLIRIRHPNRDCFLANLFDYALKDDGASMEAPIFTLSTKPDLSIWEWRSKDGNKYVKVAPSVLGRATLHDKDVLIYIVSQLTEALNRGRDDAKNRTVRFTVYDFLVTTNRGTSGDDYKRLQQAFERLAGTRITTDIKTGGERVKQGFGIIDEWRIVEKSPTEERMIAVEITISRWLHNAVKAFEVFTIHPDYFRLRRPIARRLYELARKHCGHQAQWSVHLPLLHEKSGSKAALKHFHDDLKEIAGSDQLPEFRILLSEAGRLSDVKVTFYARDTKRLARSIGGR